MIYNKFDKFISEFSSYDFPGDFWYDIACIEADEMLKEFSDDDWILLLNNFEKKNKFWKKRFLESISEVYRERELSIILNNILDSGDKDLIILSFNILRDYRTLDKKTKEKIKNFYSNTKIEGEIDKIITNEIIRKIQ